MSTILASTSQADGATTTTSVFAYNSLDVIRCSGANSATTPPSEPAHVSLYLSADNVTFYEVDTRWFGMAPGGTYYQRFVLSDYSARPSDFGLTVPWSYYKLKFFGNVGAAVTIDAIETTFYQVKEVTLTGQNTATAGGLGSWVPSQGGPIFVTQVIIAHATNSTGSATIGAGVAANATTNSLQLVNATQLNNAANTITFSGTGTTAVVGAVLTGTQAVTFASNANSSGYTGKAYIFYVKP